MRKLFVFARKIVICFVVLTFFCTSVYADSNPSMTISWPTDNEKYATGSEQTYNPTLSIDKDYIQLEYIETTSSSENATQYFDTSFHHDNNSKYEMEIMFKTLYPYDAVFGATGYPRDLYGHNTQELYLFRHSSRNGALRINAGNASTYQTEDFVPDFTVKYKITVDAPNKKIYNGTTSVCNTWVDNVQYCDSSDYIFAFNNGDTPSAQGHYKLYYFKIFDGDSLVRNFIPVLTLKEIDASKVNEGVSIPAGTPCLFDLKNNRFHKNIGTEEFAAGPALVTLNGTQYGVLEYIKSNGTNYIDTDVKYTCNDIKISIGFNQESGAYAAVVGNYDTTSGYRSSITVYAEGTTNGVIYHSPYGSDVRRKDNYYSLGTYNEFDVERKEQNIIGYKNFPSVSAKETIAEGCANVLTTSNPYIFAQNSPGGAAAQYSKTSLYYLEMYNTVDADGKYNIIRNYIPVKRMSDGVLGLYDLVSNRFFTKASGDNFITNDHTPTGQNAIYHIVDNNFHEYSGKETDSNDYVAGVKLGNIGKVIFASNNKNLTHNWSILSNKFNPSFNAYNGQYDGNNHDLSLINVKDYYNNIIDSSKYTIEYSLDNGTTYDKDIADINAFYNNFKDIGEYAVKYKITSITAGVYEDLLGTIKIYVKKKSSSHVPLYVVPNTGV